MNEAPDRTIILGLQHWVTRPDLETIFETKMVSNWSRDHFETKMSHYLEWRDWFRDHIRDQNGLNSGLETSIDTKMSHSGLQRPIGASPVNIFHMMQVSNRFPIMRVPKVLLPVPPLKIKNFGPKTAVVTLWRAGCISQVARHLYFM